jgi:hypothetical protein
VADEMPRESQSLAPTQEGFSRPDFAITSELPTIRELSCRGSNRNAKSAHLYE